VIIYIYSLPVVSVWVFSLFFFFLVSLSVACCWVFNFFFKIQVRVVIEA
jgi:hypothetical protein